MKANIVLLLLLWGICILSIVNAINDIRSTDHMSVYVLRMEGENVPDETYVGAESQPKTIVGALAFAGEGGGKQAIAAARYVRNNGWDCSVIEIRGPVKVIHREKNRDE